MAIKPDHTRVPLIEQWRRLRQTMLTLPQTPDMVQMIEDADRQIAQLEADQHMRANLQSAGGRGQT